MLVEFPFQINSPETFTLRIKSQLIFQLHINGLAGLFYRFIDNIDGTQHIIYRIIYTFYQLCPVGCYFYRSLRYIDSSQRNTLSLAALVTPFYGVTLLLRQLCFEFGI